MKRVELSISERARRGGRRRGSSGSRRSRDGLLVGLAVLGLGPIAPVPGQAKDLAQETGPLPTLEIAPRGGQSFRVAVLRFGVAGAPVGDERVATLRDEIERGIAYSSEVMPLDRDAYLAPEESPALNSGPIDCASWKAGGADAVVLGEVRREGMQLRADLRIVEVARCADLRTGRVVGDRDRLPDLGRRIADETVEALTGLRGVAATEIAFISDRTGERELYVMSADGRDQRPATASRTLKMFPEWTPDGQAVLYTNYAGGQPGFSIVSRSDEIEPGPILDRLLPGMPKYRGRFDPTGEELAMVTSADGAAEIFRVRRKGSEPTRLTNHPAIDISPSWSPDGRQLVFCSDRSGAPQLYVMDRDGGSLRRLTYTGTYNASPVWSPDGRWIAYETRVRGQFDLWLIDPSGQVNFPIVQHSRSDEAPSWSPDGRKIAFSSARRGRFDLYVMDWNGENVQRLTSRSGKNVQPDWGPQVR
jgi:TolB protein